MPRSLDATWHASQTGGSVMSGKSEDVGFEGSQRLRSNERKRNCGRSLPWLLKITVTARQLATDQRSRLSTGSLTEVGAIATAQVVNSY